MNTNKIIALLTLIVLQFSGLASYADSMTGGGGGLSAPVANSSLATMANNTVKGNVSGITATPSDLNTTQLTTLIVPATDLLSGAAPALTDGRFYVGKTGAAIQLSLIHI